MARRRRRRPGESTEGEDAILEDDDDDLDIRVTSIEEELQNLLLTTQESVRDQRATRARLDKMARELEDDAEGDDELFQELDQFKQATNTQLENLSQAQLILTDRLGEVGERLGDVGGQGPLENVLTALQEQFQSQLASLNAAREEESDLISTRLEELNQNFEASTARLRQELQAALADQSQTQALAQDFTYRFESLTSELDNSLREISNGYKTAISELTTQQSGVQQQIEATLAELADALDSRAGTEDLQEVRAELQRLSANLADQTELGNRAHAAVGRVEQLEQLLQQQGDRYDALVQRSQKLADETDKYSDKVDLAVRLVRALEDKGRGGAGADLGDFAGSSSSVSESDLEAPEKTDLGFGLRDLLNVMSSNQASDLHIKVGSTPMVRLHGDLIPVGNHSLGEEDCRRLIFSALTKEERRKLLQARSLDFTFEQPGLRLRGHAFFQRGRLCASLKMLRNQMPSLEELGLPAVLRRSLGNLKSGVILVTGPLGSGKSTTVAAMVDELNRTRKLHILTLESPISFLHQDQQSLITQREAGTDYQDQIKAILDGLKHDPDALVVDPLNNAEAALTAFAAGDSEFVIASLEAPNLLSALERLFHGVQRFPNLCDRQQIAFNLRAVISQRLLPRADKTKGLIPAAEVLIVNSQVSQLLIEGNFDQLSAAVQKGTAGEGSQTMSQSLGRLVDAGLISDVEAGSLLPSAESGGGATPSDDSPLMRWL